MSRSSFPAVPKMSQNCPARAPDRPCPHADRLTTAPHQRPAVPGLCFLPSSLQFFPPTLWAGPTLDWPDPHWTDPLPQTCQPTSQAAPCLPQCPVTIYTTSLCTSSAHLDPAWAPRLIPARFLAPPLLNPPHPRPPNLASSYQLILILTLSLTFFLSSSPSPFLSFAIDPTPSTPSLSAPSDAQVIQRDQSTARVAARVAALVLKRWSGPAPSVASCRSSFLSL